MSDSQPIGHAVSADTRVPYGRGDAVKRDMGWWRRAIGAAISRVAIEIFGSHKVAAGKLGADEREFGKWCTGERRPQFDLLFACAPMRTPLMLAFGELDGRIEVVRQMRHVERRRGGQ